VEHKVVPVVTAVPPREIRRFLRARDQAEARRFLKRLKYDEILIAPRPGRLQAKVRGVGLVYIFRGHPSDVPRIRPERRPTVIRW